MIKLNTPRLWRDLEVRDSRFYSIQEMANDLGLSEGIVNRVMCNKVVILDVRILEKLIHYFQIKGLAVSAGDFFRWEGDELVLNIGVLMARLDPIPTFHDVSSFTGINRETSEDLITGNMSRIKLSTLWLFLKYFRYMGLGVNLGDLLLEEETGFHYHENKDDFHDKKERVSNRIDRNLLFSEIDAESVPIIRMNIIALKHLLIAKKRKIYSNEQICEGAKVRSRAVKDLIEGNFTWRHLSTIGKLAHYFQSEGLVIQVGDFFRWEGQELVLNTDFLMTRLDPIPTDEEVCDETGISFLRVGDLVRGHVKQISFHNLGALLLFFRKRGLDIKLGNLLREKGASLPRVEFFKDEERVRLAEERKAKMLARKMVDIGMDVAQIMNKDFPYEQMKVETPTLAATRAAAAESEPKIGFNFFTLKHLLMAIKDKEYSTKEIYQGSGLSGAAYNFLKKGGDISLMLRTINKLVYYFQSEGLVIEAGDFFRWEGKELVLNIGSLMTRLNPVPTYEEVHDETGIPFSRVKNLVKGNVRAIDLHGLGALLLFFRKKGLSVDLGDLLREEGVDSLPRMFSFGVEEKVRLAEERQVVSTARKMLALGMDVAQIATVTDLSLEQIKVLGAA